MICKDQDIGNLIGGYELSLLSEEEKRRFEDHLLECEHCFQNLYRTTPLSTMIRERKLAPAEAVELVDEEDEESLTEPPKRGGPTRVFRKFWIYAAAGAAAVMVVALMVIWLQGPGRETERLRGHDEISILVVSPVGEVTALGELKWKTIAGIDTYKVRITTEAGDLVWEESVKGFTATLPESVKKILIPGRIYGWHVEARSAEGEQLKSQLIQFSIRK